jgi:hypothetical protein
VFCFESAYNVTHGQRSANPEAIEGAENMDFLPVNPHEYQQLIFLAQVFGVIAVAGIIGAIICPEEW